MGDAYARRGQQVRHVEEAKHVQQHLWRQRIQRHAGEDAVA